MQSAHLFYPSFGIVFVFDLRRLTVIFKFASKSEKSFVSTRSFGRRNRKQGKHAPAGNICFAKSFAFRRYRLVARCHRSPPGLPRVAKSTPVPSCLVHPDGLLGICRSACGLTRREKHPASAAGWRAWSRETCVVSNGRRLRTVFMAIRATACIPATLTHAIVLLTMRCACVI